MSSEHIPRLSTTTVGVAQSPVGAPALQQWRERDGSPRPWVTWPTTSLVKDADTSSLRPHGLPSCRWERAWVWVAWQTLVVRPETAGAPRTGPSLVVLLSVLALGFAVLAGTLGSFGIGFGVGTSCTNEWSCGPGTCSPCNRVTHGMLLNAGGQALVVIVVVVLLVRHVDRQGIRGYLVAPIALVVSVGIFVTSLVYATSYSRKPVTERAAKVATFVFSGLPH